MSQLKKLGVAVALAVPFGAAVHSAEARASDGNGSPDVAVIHAEPHHERPSSSSENLTPDDFQKGLYMELAVGGLSLVGVGFITYSAWRDREMQEGAALPASPDER